MRKNKKQIMDKVHKFVTNPSFEGMSQFLIIDVKGGYELFGEFLIVKKNDKFIVKKHLTDLEMSFNSQRNAVVWTTFYYRNRISEAKRIHLLDEVLSGIEVNLEIHTKLYRRTSDQEKKLIYFAKLQEDQRRKKSTIAELDGFAKSSKIWQNYRFSQMVK